MKSLKSLSTLTILSIFLLVLVLNPVSGVAKEKYEEKFEKTITIAKDGKVYLKNIAGDIKVETWDRAEVKIDAFKVSKASSMEKAEENAAKVKIEITEEDGILRIEAKYPKMSLRNLNVYVDFNLMIPSMAGVDVHSVSGDIWVVNIGNQHARHLPSLAKRTPSIIAILGFASILICYIGVNYLPGLHSYGG